MNKIPKILIACPTSERHKNLIDKWLSNLDKLTYSNFDVLLIDNSLDEGRYFNELTKKRVKDKPIIVLRHEWDSEKLHPLQMMAHCREEIRKYFIERGYDYLFWVDDDVFVPKNSIQRLLCYNKDLVGFYVHVFYKPGRVPCVLKSGEIIMGKGLEYFTFKEISQYRAFVRKVKASTLDTEEKNLISFIIKDKLHPEIFPTYAVGIGGGLMCSKKVMEATQFKTHPTFIYGEDLWWYSEVEDRGFTMWCDCEVRPVHENTEWNSVMKKSQKQLGFYLLYGPENAKNVELVDRSLKK